jgi:hypothetical protein
MKTIEKDELYENLSQFLKGKGIELKEGQYTKGIHAGCSLLADAINLSQAGLDRAKTQVERQFDQIRQAIHEKTAPKGKSTTGAGNPPPQPENAKTKTGSAGPSPRPGPRQKAKTSRTSRHRK